MASYLDQAKEVSRLRLIIFLIFNISSNLSWAAFGNNNSILVGDLAAGMGGAGTALVGDVSSAAYYNPATMAWLEGQSFSAASGIYKKFDTIYGEASDFTKAALRANLGFFRSLPASTGSVIHWKDFEVGLSIVVPDYDTYKGDLANKETNVTTLSMTDESLWVGGAISRKIDDDSSWGVTLYYTARSFSRSLSDRSYFSSSHNEFYTQEKTIAQNSLVPVFGYYHRFGSDWALGASLRAGSIRLGSVGSYFESSTNTQTTTTTSTTLTDLSGPVIIPRKLSLGVVWQHFQDLTVALDLQAYEGFMGRDLEHPIAGSVLDYKSVVNASLGFEWAIRNWLKLRWGGFTNFSSFQTPTASGGYDQEDKVDQLGFSANLVLYSRENMSFTFGGYYTGGRGRSVKRVNQQLVEMDKTQQVFTMLVGTSFYL